MNYVSDYNFTVILGYCEITYIHTYIHFISDITSVGGPLSCKQLTWSQITLKSSSLRFDGGIVAQAIVVISFVGHTLFFFQILALRCSVVYIAETIFQGHSRSLQMALFDIICHFLLIFHCNYVCCTVSKIVSHVYDCTSDNLAQNMTV